CPTRTSRLSPPSAPAAFWRMRPRPLRRRPRSSLTASRLGPGASWLARTLTNWTSASGRRRKTPTRRSSTRALPRRSAGGSGEPLAKLSTRESSISRGDPVSQPAMAGTIGQAIDRGIAAETEIRKARRADRPAAGLLAQFKQRAAMSVVDRRLKGNRLVERHGSENLAAQPCRHLSSPGLRRIFGRAVDVLLPHQLEAGDLADHRVAAHPDLVGDLAAGQAGGKMEFKEFDAFGGPGQWDCGHFRFQA